MQASITRHLREDSTITFPITIGEETTTKNVKNTARFCLQFVLFIKSNCKISGPPRSNICCSATYCHLFFSILVLTTGTNTTTDTERIGSKIIIIQRGEPNIYQYSAKFCSQFVLVIKPNCQIPGQQKVNFCCPLICRQIAFRIQDV